MPNIILPVIEKTGGRAIARRQITEIIIDNGVAIGVKAKKSNKSEADIEEYYAPIIISDAGAFNTYTKLIPENYPIPYREKIKVFPKGVSNVTLYMGFKESPAKLGFKGENHTIFQDYDHDKTYEKLTSLKEFPTGCYLSFPSLKDPAAQSHTGEIISLIDYNCFTQWQDRPWKRRGEEYNQLKEQLSQSLIALVESKYPGFQDLIAYSELSTSVISHGELIDMAERSQHNKTNLILVQNFLRGIYVHHVDITTANLYGQIKASIFKQFAPKEKSKRRKTKIINLGFDENDLWITAIALQHLLTIVSVDGELTSLGGQRSLPETTFDLN